MESGCLRLGLLWGSGSPPRHKLHVSGQIALPEVLRLGIGAHGWVASHEYVARFRGWLAGSQWKLLDIRCTQPPFSNVLVNDILAVHYHLLTPNKISFTGKVFSTYNKQAPHEDNHWTLKSSNVHSASFASCNLFIIPLYTCEDLIPFQLRCSHYLRCDVKLCERSYSIKKISNGEDQKVA